MSWILKRRLTYRCCARSISEIKFPLNPNPTLEFTFTIGKRPLNMLYNDKEESKEWSQLDSSIFFHYFEPSFQLPKGLNLGNVRKRGEIRELTPFSVHGPNFNQRGRVSC